MKLYKGNQEFFQKTNPADAEVIANSQVMKAIVKKIDNTRYTHLPSLILGEAGTGKNFIAYEIYKVKNTNSSFRSFNCQGLLSEVLETELFGDSNTAGVLQKAIGHVLHLESVDSLSMELQTRLMQFFQETNAKDTCSHIQIIATADSKLAEKVKNKRFREDLFSFLSNTMIILPSLKDRTMDIDDLFRSFLYSQGFSGAIDSEASSILEKYSWPGNLTELKNFAAKCALICKGRNITLADIPEQMKNQFNLAYFVKYNPKIDLKTLTNFYISLALNHFGSKKEAGQALGISVKTIYNKIDKQEV